MKFCPSCHLQPITIFDYCSNCGAEMTLVWKFKCLECGHGSDISSKFCCCCGSNLFIANQEPEDRDETKVKN